MMCLLIIPEVDADVPGRVIGRTPQHEPPVHRLACAARRRPACRPKLEERRLKVGVHLVAFVLLFASCLSSSFAADGRRKAREDQSGQRPARGAPSSGVFLTDVPAHPFDLILGRPTRDSVTLNVLTYADLEGFVSWSADETPTVSGRTSQQLFKSGEPVEIVLGPLVPDTLHCYHFHTRAAGSEADAPFAPGLEHTFHTARPPGRAFTFTITADSHLDENTTPAIYERSLANALADAPDFHLDLGDTFMTEKRPDHRTALPQYLAQRYYFGRLAASAPLFLVLGNHDGETGRRLDGPPDNLPLWSNLTRKRFFPNPEPDAFYSGNATPDPRAGRLQDYYAWEWGDALFVVLDPFSFTTRPRGDEDNWSRTLGRAQYDWLARTLAQSKARFRFIFIHHLVGGLDRQSRGGVEAARLFEWGGRDATGRDVFGQKRPGWPMPIHDLLVRNNVTAVFHGHDHLFAEQELDGILYQEVPQPGHRRGGAHNATGYGYREGVILDGSGHLRVAVAPERVVIEFVLASGSRDDTGGSVAHTRTIE
jgi:hypothetical protein